MWIRTYSELSRIGDYEGRFNYLKLHGNVGESTFGFDRYLNQRLYTSKEWKETRQKVILRDEGCDMGLVDHPIGGRIVIHHLNPLTMEQIEDGGEDVFDPEYLVCVSYMTHEAIHFGDASLLPKLPIERRPGDTCLWR